MPHMGSKIYIYCPIILIRNFFHYFPKLDSQSLIGLMEFVSLDVQIVLGMDFSLWLNKISASILQK